MIQGNEIWCGEFGIYEPRISALITIPGDSALSDRKPGDLFLTNLNSGKYGMGKRCKDLSCQLTRGEGIFFSFNYYQSFFNFKLFKVMIQGKMTK